MAGEDHSGADAVGSMIDSIDAVGAELARARTEVNALGQTLTQAEARIVEYESALASAAESLERDGATTGSSRPSFRSATAFRHAEGADRGPHDDAWHGRSRPSSGLVRLVYRLN